MILKKGFYFSYKYNVTLALKEQKSKVIADKFAWNISLLTELTHSKVDHSWKYPIIQGFVKSF